MQRTSFLILISLLCAQPVVSGQNECDISTLKRKRGGDEFEKVKKQKLLLKEQLLKLLAQYDPKDFRVAREMLAQLDVLLDSVGASEVVNILVLLARGEDNSYNTAASILLGLYYGESRHLEHDTHSESASDSDVDQEPAEDTADYWYSWSTHTGDANAIVLYWERSYPIEPYAFETTADTSDVTPEMYQDIVEGDGYTAAYARWIVARVEQGRYLEQNPQATDYDQRLLAYNNALEALLPIVPEARFTWTQLRLEHPTFLFPNEADLSSQQQHVYRELIIITRQTGYHQRVIREAYWAMLDLFLPQPFESTSDIPDDVRGDVISILHNGRRNVTTQEVPEFFEYLDLTQEVLESQTMIGSS